MQRKTDSRQMSKYRQYVDEMQQATRLLLLLAGRLARLDNSALAPSAESQPTTPVYTHTNTPTHTQARDRFTALWDFVRDNPEMLCCCIWSFCVCC